MSAFASEGETNKRTLNTGDSAGLLTSVRSASDSSVLLAWDIVN